MEFCFADEASSSFDRIEHSARTTLLLRCTGGCVTPNRNVVLAFIRALVSTPVACASGALTRDFLLNFRLVDLAQERHRQLLDLAQSALTCKVAAIGLSLGQYSDDLADGLCVNRADKTLCRPY